MGNGSGPLRYVLSAALVLGGLHSLTNQNRPPEPERCATRQAIKLIDITTKILAEPYRLQAQARAEALTDQSDDYSFNDEATITRPPGFNP
jgi:hypothetical protein|tara:strand:- start:816 stop:1088 length:273 start_codon:yes stop_codon:yes gene_type:complete